MISTDVYKLPMIAFAHRFQVVDILRLKRLVVFAGVAAR